MKLRNTPHPLYSRYLEKQAIREWNSKFTAAPVSTGAWTETDFKTWEESRLLLPEFSDCLEAFKPSLVSVSIANSTALAKRSLAYSYIRSLRSSGVKLKRVRVRSSVGIVADFDGLEKVIVSYRSTLNF